MREDKPSTQKQNLDLLSPMIIEKFVGRVRYIETRNDPHFSGVNASFEIRIPDADPLEMFRRLDKALEIICWGEVKNDK